VPAVYLDTSVLGRVLLGEPDARAILDALGDFDQHISSRLLRLELRRLAFRHGCLADGDQLLAGVAMIPVDDQTLVAAETIPPATVATLDAIHLVAALRLAEADLLDTVMTYDARLAAGAREHGLTVRAPR
jgi:predicted nucleic acid-binding protein